MKPAPSTRPRASTRLLCPWVTSTEARAVRLSFKPPLTVPPLSANAAQVRSALRHNDVCRERFAVGHKFDTPDLHHTTFCVYAATTKQEVVFISPVWCSDFSCAFDAKNFNYISRLLHEMENAVTVKLSAPLCYVAVFRYGPLLWINGWSIVSLLKEQ